MNALSIHEGTLLYRILELQQQSKLLWEIADILNKPLFVIHAEINAWLARHPS
jgi:hypothetical protein